MNDTKAETFDELSPIDWLIKLGREEKQPHTLLLDRAEADLARITAERDEAVTNANAYRARVFDFLDAMINESKITQAQEEKAGLEPIDRTQYQTAIAYIRRAFENHDYLKEAEVAGSVTEFERYETPEELAAALNE